MEHSFTTDQVAKFCQSSRGSVVRWIHEGKLKAAITPGGHHRVLRADLIQFLEGLGFPIPVELLPEEKEKKRILIVEDDESQRRLLRHFVTKQFPDCEIEEAGDGFDAGIKVHRFRPHLVLLDICLPGEDGLVVCRHIRSIPEFKGMAIIGMTGVHDPEVKKNMLQSGADDFLWKPYELDVLEEKIQKLFLKKDAHGNPSQAA